MFHTRHYVYSDLSLAVQDVNGEEQEVEEEEEAAAVIPFTGFKVAVTPARVESPFVEWLPNGYDMTNFVVSVCNDIHCFDLIQAASLAGFHSYCDDTALFKASTDTNVEI